MTSTDIPHDHQGGAVPAQPVPASDKTHSPEIVTDGPWSEQPLLAEVVEPPPRQRRVGLPLILFAVTCLSTFWAGAAGWEPANLQRLLQGDAFFLRMAVIRHWDHGLIYMACVLAILLAHEMGHFLATIRYRISASLPFFIPVPITPIGTMGAVIGMDGLKADRKELFDIGLAGPIAGLVVAIPILCVGINGLDLTQPDSGTVALDSPLMINLLMAFYQPPGYEAGEHVWSTQQVWTGQLNAYFMAGWVGLLITGLNMLPISQLDGGHVLYTLFGKKAHWIARLFLLGAIVFIVFGEAHIWTVMVVIVVLIGTDHPPTSNDRMNLGPVRTAIGLVSLLIPVFCFPPFGLTQVGM